MSVAYSITDSIDVGLGIVYFDTVLESTVTMYLADDDTVEAYFAPNSYLPERSLLTQTGNSDETDWTLTAGLLWSTGVTTGCWQVRPTAGMVLRDSIPASRGL